MYLKKKQLGAHVRFFDKDVKKVTTRYLDSRFVGHSTADDLKKELDNITAVIPKSNLLQIGMDGPSVNWKMFRAYSSEMSRNYGHQVLELGSCGLHVLNNVFQVGSRSSGWEVNEFLSSLYYLFKDSPARSSDFFTGLDQKNYHRSLLIAGGWKMSLLQKRQLNSFQKFKSLCEVPKTKSGSRKIIRILW